MVGEGHLQADMLNSERMRTGWGTWETRVIMKGNKDHPERPSALSKSRRRTGKLTVLFSKGFNEFRWKLTRNYEVVIWRTWAWRKGTVSFSAVRQTISRRNTDVVRRAWKLIQGQTSFCVWYAGIVPWTELIALGCTYGTVNLKIRQDYLH